MEAAVLLVPYFKSEFGKKVVEGQNVEEGEGMGPRKELFSLLSAQLQHTSTRCDQELYVSGQAGTNTLVTPQGTAFPAEMMVGWKLQVVVNPGLSPETTVGKGRTD